MDIEKRNNALHFLFPVGSVVIPGTKSIVVQSGNGLHIAFKKKNSALNGTAAADSKLEETNVYFTADLCLGMATFDDADDADDDDDHHALTLNRQRSQSQSQLKQRIHDVVYRKCCHFAGDDPMPHRFRLGKLEFKSPKCKCCFAVFSSSFLYSSEHTQQPPLHFNAINWDEFFWDMKLRHQAIDRVLVSRLNLRDFCTWTRRYLDYTVVVTGD